MPGWFARVRAARRSWLPCLFLLGLGLAVLAAWPEATVLIESNPAGAEVTYEGQQLGQTPLRLASRPLPLQGRAQVSLEGFRTWVGPIRAYPGESSRLLVELQSSQVEPTASARFAWPTATAAPLRPTPVAAPPTPTDSLPRPPARPSASPSPLPSPSASPAPLSTAPLRARLAGPPSPLAIVVENSPEARPQSGLDAADLVYEALAEGGITRFLAVYVNGEPSTVGPVRSARHYFVSLAAELGAPLVHIGASPQGYALLRELNLPDLDETYGHPGFWRSAQRPAPHNAYTSIAGARTALSTRPPGGPGSWGGFAFKEQRLAYQGAPAQRLQIDYPTWGYRVEYRYDPRSGLYDRFMAGAPHLDGESHEQIRAGAIAVLTVKSWVIDEVGRLDFELIGQGPATCVLDGVAIEGSWQQGSASEPRRFVDRTGQPIRFNGGPVWIQIVPPESKVNFGNAE
jgi:hypothetical protein